MHVCLLLSLHVCTDATGMWPNGNNTASPRCQSCFVSIFKVQRTCHPALTPPVFKCKYVIFTVSTDRHVWLSINIVHWYYLVEVNSESSRSHSDLQSDWNGCSYSYIRDLWSLQSICSLNQGQHTVVFSWRSKGTWIVHNINIVVYMQLNHLNFVWYPCR